MHHDTETNPYEGLADSWLTIFPELGYRGGEGGSIWKNVF